MKQDLFVGTYSKYGVYHLKFDNGIFEEISKDNSFENCSWLCKNDNVIYSVLEFSDVSKFKNGYLIARTYNLTPINSIDVSGVSPCYILLDKFRNLLFTAYYSNGSIEVFNLKNDGSINSSIFYKEFTSHSHIHCLGFSKDNQFLFVIDLGTNTIFAFKIIYDGDTFDLKEFASYNFPLGSGPRHLALNGNIIFVITENSCELYKLAFSNNSGFKFCASSSLFPNNVKMEKDFTGAGIKISNDNKFVYTSIRGHNRISVFDFNTLELIQNISCFGKTPRDISFDSSQNYLLCANQNSSNISIFERNKKTGYLNYASSYPIVSPVCII